jgi:hypothetical protein
VAAAAGTVGPWAAWDGGSPQPPRDALDDFMANGGEAAVAGAVAGAAAAAAASGDEAHRTRVLGELG